MKKNSHPVKVVEIKDYEGLYANSHPYKVEVEGGGGGETYSDFTGATDISAGDHGLVPAPKAGDNHKYLKGDGTWAEVSGGGGSGIPTDATFWGASYDAVNNKVDGGLLVTNNRSLRIMNGLSAGQASIESTKSGSLEYLNINGVTGIQFGLGATAGYFGTINTLGWSVNNFKILNLADPTLAQDAATKYYTDNLVISYTSLNGAGAPTTATEAKYVGQLYYDTTNDDMYYCSAITAQGTTPETYEYTWDTIGGGPTVVQTTGTSQTDVMSQVATSQLIYPSGYETTGQRMLIGKNSTITSSANGQILIGYNSSISSNYSGQIVIGNGASATGQQGICIGGKSSGGGSGTKVTGGEGVAVGFDANVSGVFGVAISEDARATARDAIAIGERTRAGHKGSIALGGDGNNTGSATGREMELSLGAGTAGDANEKTRYIAHVRDPQLVTDAANKRYVDTAIAGASASAYTPSEFNNLWENA